MPLPFNSTMALEVGAVFNSYCEFKKVFDAQIARSNHVFVLKNTQQIATKNKRIKNPEKQYPAELQYFHVELQCKHAGSYTSRSTGIRRDQDTFKTGCQAHVNLTANKSKGGLVITDICLTHNGHAEAAEGERFIYPENRRLTDAQVQELLTLHYLGAQRSKIITHFKAQYHVDLLPSDITNHINRKRQLHGRDDRERAINLLKNVVDDDPHASVDIVTDASETATILFLQTSEMKRVFASYPELLFIDGTYKVNSHNMPLYVLMVQDGNYNGQVVAYALVLNETIVTIENVLSLFIKNNQESHSLINTVMLDKSSSEIGAIQTKLPNASIILCNFHVDQAFQRHLKGYPSELRGQILLQLRKMYKCKTEDQYSSLKNSIMNLSFQFHDYFMKNWDSEKEKWVGCHLKTKLTYGNLTNNIVESHNQKIKSAVNQNSSLCDLLRNLLTLSKMTAQKTRARVSKLKLKKRQYVGNQVPVNLLNTINMMCTPHASAIIRAEMDKCYNEIFIVQENCVFEKGKAFHLDLLLKRCSCYISTYQRLPCRHLMSYRKENGGEIIEEADVPDHYNLQKYLNSFSTDQPVSSSTQNVAVLPLHNCTLNATEKYNIAKRVLSGTCDVLAQMGQKQFERCLDMYRAITEKVKCGRDIIWFDIDRMAGEDVNTEQEEISEEVENEKIGQEAWVGVKEVVQGGHEVTVEVEELEQRFGVELEEVEQRVGVKIGDAEQRFGTVGEAGQRVETVGEVEQSAGTVGEAGQRSRTVREVEKRAGTVGEVKQRVETVGEAGQRSRKVREVEQTAGVEVEGVEQRPGIEVEEVVLRARVKLGWTEQSGEVKVGEMGWGTHRPELGFQDVEQGCRVRQAGECQREGILVYSTEVSNEQDISIRTSGKLIEKESLTEQNFNLPTKVKRRGRPKINKTQCKRRKLGMSFNPPMIEDRALLRLLVKHSFLDLVCSGQLLIDEYTMLEESTLKSVIGHLDLLDMDRIRPYFTSGGWVIFRSLW